MAAEVKKEIELEIAHVLFLDIVGYSKLSVNEQHARVEELNEIVRLCEQFRKAEAASRLFTAPRSASLACSTLLVGGKCWPWTKAAGRSRSRRWKKMSTTAAASFSTSPSRQPGRAKRSLPCSNWKLDCVLPPHH